MNLRVYIIFGISILIIIMIAVAIFYYARKIYKKKESEVAASNYHNLLFFKIDYQKNQVVFSEFYKIFGKKRILKLTNFLSLIISDNYLYLRRLLLNISQETFTISDVPIELKFLHKSNYFILKLLQYDNDNKILYCRLSPFKIYLSAKDDKDMSIEKYFQTANATVENKNNFIKYSLAVKQLMTHKSKFNYLTSFCFSIKDYYLIKRYYGPTVINYLQDLYVAELKKNFKNNFVYFYLTENTLFILTNKFNDESKIYSFLEAIFAKIHPMLDNRYEFNLNLLIYVGVAFLNTSKFSDIVKLENGALLAKKIAYFENKTIHVININTQLPKIIYSSGLVELKTKLDEKQQLVDLLPYHNASWLNSYHHLFVKPTLDLNPLINYEYSFLLFDQISYRDVAWMFLKNILNDALAICQKNRDYSARLVININFKLMLTSGHEIIKIIESIIGKTNISVVLILEQYYSFSFSKIKTILNLTTKKVKFGLGAVSFYSNIKQLLSFCQPQYVVYSRTIMRKLESFVDYGSDYSKTLAFGDIHQQLKSLAIFLKLKKIFSLTPAKEYKKIKQIIDDFVDFAGLESDSK